MKKQMGVSLGGLIVVLFVLIFVALLGFKLFTPYSEYFTIQKAFKQMAANPEVKSGNKSALMTAWFPIAQISNIRAISGEDIEVAKEGNEVTISASYTVKVPLFSNISLVIDFAPKATAK